MPARRLDPAEAIRRRRRPPRHGKKKRISPRLAFVHEYGFDASRERHPAAPRLRADCRNGPRPCPWIGCKHNLTVTVRQTQRLGAQPTIIWNRGRQGHRRQSCELDVIDQGDYSLGKMRFEDIGIALGLTRERVRQIGTRAEKRFLERLQASGITREDVKAWLSVEGESSDEPMRSIDRSESELPESFVLDARQMDRASRRQLEIRIERRESGASSEPPSSNGVSHAVRCHVLFL